MNPKSIERNRLAAERLRDAAPELLSALEDMVARCVVTYGEDAHYTLNARAAIAKAKGETA